MRTHRVVTAVNPSSGTVRKSNIANASAGSGANRWINMSTAENTRTKLAAITEVAQGQLLEFLDSNDNDVLYEEEIVYEEGNQDTDDAGGNDPSSSEGDEGNALASFTKTERQRRINPTGILRLKGLHQIVHIVSVRERKSYIVWSDVSSSGNRRLRVGLRPAQS
jgi:hypothetical protein